MANDYNGLVEKLAAEIIESVAGEMQMEKEAGVNLASAKRKAMSMAKGLGDMANPKKAFKSAKRLAGKKYIAGIGLGGTKKGDKKRLGRAAGLYGGAAALGAGGFALANRTKKKAFEILEEAQMQKIAASEVMEEAELAVDAVFAALEEVGVDPEEFLAEIAEAEEFDGEEDEDLEDEE
jgi:hypothetical protein